MLEACRRHAAVVLEERGRCQHIGGAWFYLYSVEDTSPATFPMKNMILHVKSWLGFRVVSGIAPV